MSANAMTTHLRKPLADRLATLAATPKVAADAAPEAIIAGIQSLAVDPSKYFAKSVYGEGPFDRERRRKSAFISGGTCSARGKTAVAARTFAGR
jgi:hypothetical protein